MSERFEGFGAGRRRGRTALRVLGLLGIVVLLAASSTSLAVPKFGDWSAPTHLGPVVNSPVGDIGPAISKDGLSLFLTSSRPGTYGNLDLWVSQRASESDPWGTPMNLGPTMNTAGVDSVPALSRDEHWLFFNSDRTGGYGQLDLWASYREHVHDAFDWSAPFNLGPTINTAYLDVGPSYFENDEVGVPLLYFNSDRPGGLGFHDIYVSAQMPGGSWGTPAVVAELSSPSRDQRPVIRSDGLEAFLWSDRPGGLGGGDLYVSTRETTSDPWGAPVNLGPTVNSPQDDVQSYLSADRTTLYFASNRPGGLGGYDLWMTTRQMEGGSAEGTFGAAPDVDPTSGTTDQYPVVTIDHQVPHVSTVPANEGELVHLFVREVRPENRDPVGVVLMIHGRTTPVLAGFDLRTDDLDRGHHSWALWLARSAGFDVFMLDFQGSGLSPRPRMDDPCNVPSAQQVILIPNPLSGTCPPSYPYQLTSSNSDWDELDAVVDYIRELRGVEKISLIGWSQASFRVGPYVVQHPEKVERLFLYAPIYNPNGRVGSGPDGFGVPDGVTLPLPGTPMTLGRKADQARTWNAEVKCAGQVEDGMQDRVWAAIMENDPIGRTWGPPPAGAPLGSPPEGVNRIRTFSLPAIWGWNSMTASRISVPVLIIAGEHDSQVNLLAANALGQLYNTIPHDQKMWFTVQCAGHFMVWETQRDVLFHVSKDWLKDGTVDEYTSGRFWVDHEGNVLPL